MLRTVGKTIGEVIVKVLLYVIAILVIALAIFYAIKWYDHANTTSQTYGTPEIVDDFEQIDIADIDLSNEIIFYSSEQTRSYQKTINEGAEFDGAENTYNLLVNSTPADRVDTSSSNLDATHQILIYGKDNEQLATISLNIQIQFYQEETVLTISTVADDTVFGYLQSYIRTNGFRLQVIQGGYDRADIDFYYSIKLADITVSEQAELTNGVAEPDITITYGGVTLVENTDYTVLLENNTTLGTGVATITGIGIYTGTVVKTFMVAGSATITLDDIDVYWRFNEYFDFADYIDFPTYTKTVGNTRETYRAEITSLTLVGGGEVSVEEIEAERLDGQQVWSCFGTVIENLVKSEGSLSSIKITAVTYSFPGVIEQSNLPGSSAPPSLTEVLEEPVTISVEGTENLTIIEGLKESASTVQVVGTIALGDDVVEFTSQRGQQRVITVDGVNIIFAIYCFADDELTVIVNSADSARLDDITITLTSVMAYQ